MHFTLHYMCNVHYIIYMCITLHFLHVHYQAEHEDIGAAVAEGKQDSLAVLGFFLQVSFLHGIIFAFCKNSHLHKYIVLGSTQK